MRYSEQILKKEKERIDNLLDRTDSLQDQQAFMAMVDDIDNALDNLTSSSRIIHSQPQHGSLYWIRRKESTKYEVAEGMTVNETRCLVPLKNTCIYFPNELGDWISEPLNIPKG